MIKNIPKIELHCHLDGSLSLELVQRLLQARGEDFTLEELREQLQAPKDCGSLSDYLRRFDLPNEVLQQPEELRAAAYDLAMRAAGENVRYLEVRFAPKFSTAEGLTVRQVLEAVIEGLKQAEEESDICTGVIVCGMRGLNENANLAMLKEAAELYGFGVVACDLAGDEKAYPITEFTYFFEAAKRYGMPFTIHAGECGSRDNIQRSVALGASRIGHGIAMLGDKNLQKLCADQRIGVELCPTSNLQTGAVWSLDKYPLREFMEAGIPISVNTDNRTVSGTDMTQEFSMLKDAFSLKEEEIKRICRDSVEVSFASDDVKHTLLDLFQ